jgi:hypothetical protein
MTGLKRIRTITSHRGLARWLAELSEEPVAYLARVQTEPIASPYAYSPSVALWDWNGLTVCWFETAHRHYEIFEVSKELLRFKSDADATDWHIRFSRKSA